MSAFGLADAGIGFVLMLVMLALGLHVATTILLLGVIGAALFLGGPIVAAVGTQFWGATESFVLLAVPLFVLLGELLVRGGATDRMYRALAAWLGVFPGGLLHTNIGACALFAATSGSSVATAATVGTVALPSLQRRGYSMRASLGSLAA
ncbi:MAG TPA: TRAP transporter large permease subunit, partial [Roseomonas sp.]|nr:TRAP transporter large permease subunit [Roseomonas sp.]